MIRMLLIALLGLYLIAIGLWPPAAAPIAAALTGAAVILGLILGLIPGPVWLGIGAIAWLKRQPAPVVVAAE
jgi:hypothetical protein